MSVVLCSSSVGFFYLFFLSLCEDTHYDSKHWSFYHCVRKISETTWWKFFKFDTIASKIHLDSRINWWEVTNQPKGSLRICPWVKTEVKVALPWQLKQTSWSRHQWNMLSIFSSTTFSSNLHVCPYRYSELQDWSFVTISPSALFSRGRWYLLVTNFQCRIVCPELEASVNGWWYAKHISYIRVTICLCAAINLRLDVDCSRFALSYPRYCPPRLTLPVAITASDHHTDGCQPGEGSRRALVDNPYT